MAVSPVLVITVEYGNRDDTLKLIESLRNTAGENPIDLVIVDNSDESAPPPKTSLDNSPRMSVRWLKTPANLFYWGGANYALGEVDGFTSEAPTWVVICNNDIAFSDGTFFSTLALQDPRTAGILAPCIVSTVTGEDQNPLLQKAPGLLMRARWRLYDAGYPIAKLLLATRPALRALSRLSKRSRGHTPGNKEIFAPHGACVIISSEFFRRGGRLDTTVPLFAEELTLAAEASSLRVPIRHLPELRVTHREHSTTGTNLTPFKYDLERKARRRFYELVSGKP